MADANSDDYGKMSVLQLPNEQTPGPGQVANEFASNPEVADTLAQFNRSGARPVYGNLLTLPGGDGLMYVQPVYAARELSESSFPVLRYVLVKYGDEIGFGTTLRQALADMLGVSAESGGGGGGNGGDDGRGSGEPPTGTINEQIRSLLDRAEAAFDRAEELLAEGDLGGYQEQVDLAQEYVADAIALADARDGGELGAGEGEPQTDEPSGDASDEPTDEPTEEGTAG